MSRGSCDEVHCFFCIIDVYAQKTQEKVADQSPLEGLYRNHTYTRL